MLKKSTPRRPRAATKSQKQPDSQDDYTHKLQRDADHFAALLSSPKCSQTFRLIFASVFAEMMIEWCDFSHPKLVREVFAPVVSWLDRNNYAGATDALIDRYFPNFPNGHSFDAKTAEPPPRERDAPVYLDVQSVRNPSTKGRNVRYRVAASKGWLTSFTILFDKTVVDRNSMQAVLNDAGVLVGLADGRSIGFGRFTVESFEELD